MNRLLQLTLLVPLTLFTLGTVDVPVQVKQPVSLDGPQIIDVPYVEPDGSLATPGALVLRTVSENSIQGSHGGFRNINAAHLLGVRLFLVPHDEPILRGERRWQGVFGDTLRVVMDLSNIDEDTYSSTGQPIRLAWPKNEVIPRTVECMLENAKREKNDVRFLDVSIRGQDGFSDLARVYRLDEEFPDELRPRNRQPRSD